MKLLALIALLGATTCATTSRQDYSCTSIYRSFNGSCNNLAHPDWGETGQVFSPSDAAAVDLTLGSVSSSTDLSPLEDPVSEWLKELLDLILEDVFDFEITRATPYLDLSNIYNSTSGQLNPPKSLLSQVMVSEHKRMVHNIYPLRPDWTERKVFLEARRLVTGQYQSMIVRELMPLLLGGTVAEVLEAFPYDKSVKVTLAAEDLVLGKLLGKMFGYRSKFDFGGEGVSTSRSSTGLISVETLVELDKIYVIENIIEVKKKCPDSMILSRPLLRATQGFPGGEGILGLTVSCFLFQLITRLISGDRFWYENQISSKQAVELYSSSLSSLICRNLDHDSIQKKSLLLPDNSLNSQVQCSSLKDINLDMVLSVDDLELLEEELDMIDDAIFEAQEEVKKRHFEEVNLFKKAKRIPKGTPSYGKPSQASLAVARASSVLEMATYKLNEMSNKRLKRSHSTVIKNSHMRKIINSKSASYRVIEKIKTKVQKNLELKVNTVPDSPLESCSLDQDDAPCDHTARYRTFNGRCNNLQSPSKGKSTTPLRRLLPPEYDDGISQPRAKGLNGRFLPNPRVVSQAIHTTQPTPDPQFSLAVMQWGQFVDHDVAFTPIHRGFNGSILDCKSCDSARDHPACFPILIQSDDSFFPPQDRRCMPLTRSLPGQQMLGPREHINQVSHYHDASMIYGSDSCLAKKLRVPDSFLLRMTPNPASHPDRPLKGMLPLTADNEECRSADGQCFLAGDERVNEHPGLSTFHTQLVREHNDVSKELASINPHWSNEKVFQETRRIISAIIQHITYNEFLPRVLGPSSIKRFSLELLSSGYYNDYNSKCSGAIFTEFASAAFRFGHSMIRPNLTMMSEDEMMEGGGEQIPLRTVFNNPDLIRNGMAIDGLVRGLVMSPNSVVDNRISDEVSNHLFEEKGKPFSGRDLPALNIQRSRDHGIPSYNKYREICGLSRAKRFSDLTSEIPIAWVTELEAVYGHPDDVDLFPGMLAERKLAGAVVGPTLACLIGLQFRHLRSCDRYWYESGDSVVRFTEKQLQQIRGQTLSGLLCRNCDQPGSLPQAGLDQMRRLINPMMSCMDFKRIDLEVWREGKDGECKMNGDTWDLGTSTVIENDVCTCTGEGPVCESSVSVVSV